MPTSSRRLPQPSSVDEPKALRSASMRPRRQGQDSTISIEEDRAKLAVVRRSGAGCGDNGRSAITMFLTRCAASSPTVCHREDGTFRVWISKVWSSCICRRLSRYDPPFRHASGPHGVKNGLAHNGAQISLFQAINPRGWEWPIPRSVRPSLNRRPPRAANQSARLSSAGGHRRRAA